MTSASDGTVSRRMFIKGAVGAGAITLSGVGIAGAKALDVGWDVPKPEMYSEMDVKGGDEREWGVTNLTDPSGVVESTRVRRDIPGKWIDKHEDNIADSLPMPDPESFAVDFTLNPDVVPKAITTVEPRQDVEDVRVNRESENQVTWYVPGRGGRYTARVLNREVTIDNVVESISRLSNAPLFVQMAEFTFTVGEVSGV